MLKDIIGHENVKKNLTDLRSRLPRILVFAGPPGVGKKFTAYNFIDEYYLGTLGVRIKNHPDILFFEPETKTFSVELIQQVQEKANFTPFELNKKFLILRHADRMSKEAANICLKMFEECPSNISFILLTENSESLSKTILSRAVVLNFFPLPNLQNYFTDLSNLQIRLMGGCLGNKEAVEKIDTQSLYLEIVEFLLNFKSSSYSEILEWVKSKKDIGYDFLCNILNVAAADLCQKDKETDTMCALLRGISSFRDTINMNINLDNHFRNMLVQTKNSLTKKEDQKPVTIQSLGIGYANI